MRRKKILKRILSFVLALGLAIAMLLPGSSTTVYAGSKLSTAKKKTSSITTYDIAVGETLALTATGTKVTWKSANKKIATVSKKGIVTGKKKGTTTITATIKTVQQKPSKTLIGKLLKKLFPKVTKTIIKYRINVNNREPEPSIDPNNPTVDRDGDGIADIDESLYGTDPLKADTDKDGLSDFEEILLGTNPLVADNHDESLDSDSDGLSDYDEATKYRTNPSSADTDGDGLTDYEEVFVYFTDPVNIDSDGDSLSDKFEIEHGLNPNEKSSDGITPDGEVKLAQELPSTTISSSLTNDGNLAKPSLSGIVSGEMSNNIFVASLSDAALEENRAIIGAPITIDGDDSYASGLNLSFELNAYEGDKSTLVIVTLDEEGNYVPVHSSLENTTLSATIEKSGTYFVLDIDEFLSSLGIDTSEIYRSEELAGASGIPSIESATHYGTIESGANENSGQGNRGISSDKHSEETLSECAAEVDEELLASLNTANDTLLSSTISGQADIVFAIDTTGSMSSAINNVVTNVTSFATTLSKNYNVKVNYALIDFKDLEEDGPGTTKIIKNGSSNWYSDVNPFVAKVQSLYVDGGGDDPECDVDALETARRLDWRTSSNRFIILITDIYYKDANSYGIKSMEEEIELLKKDGINTSVVTTSSYQNTYRALYESTGGIFANIDSDSFSSSLLALAQLIGENTSNGTWAILKHGYRFVKLTDEIDQDGDGLTTSYELGEAVEVDLSLLIKAQLALRGVPFEHYAGKTSITMYNAKSDPTKEDTDNDGILDKEDDAPWQKGKANGIIGKLILVSCYGDGWRSGHSFFAYQSYVNDSIDFSGLANGWRRVDNQQNWVASNIKRDYSPTSSYVMMPNEYVCIGNGALGGGPVNSGNTSGTVDGLGEDSVGDANGVNYNMETAKFISRGRPLGAGEKCSYLSNTYLAEEITDTTLKKLISYLGQDEVNYWGLLHNCAKVAADGWNHISNTKVSAKGVAGWGIAATPTALRDSLRKIDGHGEDWQISEAFQ